MTFTEYVTKEKQIPSLGPDESIDMEGAHKWGWARLNKDGEVLEVIDRTNPNSRWDWWKVGGRMSGMLLSKSGKRANFLLKKDLDLEAMREDGQRQRREYYLETQRRAGGSITAETWEEARQYPFDRLEEFQCSVDEYAAKASYLPIAYVKDKTWHERGTMGMWCVVHNDTDPVEWQKHVTEMIEGLPDDAVLTIVDCHI
jgi:hypothetical protein